MSYPDPRYSGDKGEITAIFRPVTLEPQLKIGQRAKIHYLANGSSTKGEFGLYLWETADSGPGPTGHIHKTMSESFFILTGTIQLFNGERWVDAKPGDFLYVPPGAIHGFRNTSGQLASMLILFTPGAPREGYFEAIAERAAGRQFTEEEWAEICIRHDNYFIDEESQALYRKLLSKK